MTATEAAIHTTRVGELITESLKASEEYQKPVVISITEPSSGLKVDAILARDGLRAVPKAVFDEYRNAPERRKGTSTLTRLESLIDHINRFKDSDSVLFAHDDRKAPRLTAVLDYHSQGADGAPRFGQHRSVFAFPLSDEWKAWIAADGKKMPMIEFAEFIEERITDIETVDNIDDLSSGIREYIGAARISNIASASKLMELSNGLQIHETSVIKQANKLSSGEGQIRFESEHTDANGAPVDVPGLFIICIPVFAHDGYYRIAARLRYRKTGEGIMFWYDLWRTDLVFDDAFDKACTRVKEETGLPLLVGAPE